MSRCFPYPPPGYVKNGATGDALIESIKIEREKEMTKKDRKEKKREKKEKKEKKRGKEEKVKEIATKSLDGTVKNVSFNSQTEEGKGANLKKRKKDDLEHLENSDITEEHGQPVFSENLCYTSDGTQSSSKKRKCEILSSDGTRKQGRVIRILLPLQRHKGPDAPSVSKDEPFCTSRKTDSLTCSTSGRTEIATQNGDLKLGSKLIRNEILLSVQKPTEISTQNGAFTSGSELIRPPMESNNKPLLSKGHLCSTSGKLDSLICSSSGTTGNLSCDVASTSESKLIGNEMQSRSDPLYKALIEDWMPPVIDFQSFDYYEDDESWLFQSKRQDKEIKRKEMSIEFSGCGSPSLRPLARYLPEADVYALPYTIPF